MTVKAHGMRKFSRLACRIMEKLLDEEGFSSAVTTAWTVGDEMATTCTDASWLDMAGRRAGW